MAKSMFLFLFHGYFFIVCFGDITVKTSHFQLCGLFVEGLFSYFNVKILLVVRELHWKMPFEMMCKIGLHRALNPCITSCSLITLPETHDVQTLRSPPVLMFSLRISPNWLAPIFL